MNISDALLLLCDQWYVQAHLSNAGAVILIRKVSRVGGQFFRLKLLTFTNTFPHYL